MLICKWNKETQMFESMVKDGPINIIPHSTDMDKVVIKSDTTEYELLKSELLVICNKKGEKENLKEYLAAGCKEAKTLQKFYKRAELFYHNFRYDVLMREDIQEEPAPEPVKEPEVVEGEKAQVTETTPVVEEAKPVEVIEDVKTTA